MNKKCIDKLYSAAVEGTCLTLSSILKKLCIYMGK